MVYRPKVSIVIPVFNGADYLAEAIDSALAQTYENFEVLVVNDGSSDGGATERVVLGYGDRVRYFAKTNGGVASALNRAVSEMSGDYFSWLSHDDLYCENKIEFNIGLLSSLPAPRRERTIVYSDYGVFSNDPKAAMAVRLRGVPPESFRYWITVENTLHGCSLLIPKAAFGECGTFNENLRTTQDYDLWFRMAKKYRFVHLPEVLVKARSHSGQGSHKLADIALIECNELLANFIRDLDEREIPSASGKPLAESYAEIAASMFDRGFDVAGDLAADLARRHGISVDRKAKGMAGSLRRMRNMAVNSGRRLLPAKAKRVVKQMMPTALWQSLGTINAHHQDLKEKFSEVYDRNIFAGRNSRSGEGSDLVQTEIIRRELPRIVKEFSIRTFLDAPCGDWYWMKETNLGVEHYIGVDIVDAMIEKHKIEHGNPARSFLCLNLATDALPEADLIFSRDCLVHLSFEDALKIIANFKKSGAKYLLTTTFVDRTRNNDLVGKDSFWRPLNMRLPPFNFPDPLMMVKEGCTEEAGQYADKSLGLWLLSDIRI